MSILKRIEDIVLATEHKLRHSKQADDVKSSHPQEPMQASASQPELDKTIEFELVEC